MNLAIEEKGGGDEEEKEREIRWVGG